MLVVCMENCTAVCTAMHSIFTFFLIESSEIERFGEIKSAFSGCTLDDFTAALHTAPKLNYAFQFARNKNNIINLNVHVIAGNWQH